MTKNRKAKSAARTVAATGVPYVQARRELSSNALTSALVAAFDSAMQLRSVAVMLPRGASGDTRYAKIISHLSPFVHFEEVDSESDGVHATGSSNGYDVIFSGLSYGYSPMRENAHIDDRPFYKISDIVADRARGSSTITFPFEIGETFNGAPEPIFWSPAAQPILVITGAPGTGKSAALHAIAVEATWRGVPIFDQGRILPEEFGALTQAADINGPTLILLDEHSTDEAFTFFADARQDAEQHGHIFAAVVDGPVEEAPDVAHLELIGQTHFTIGNAEPRTRPWRTAMGTGAMGRYQDEHMFAWGSLDDHEARRYAHTYDTTPWALAAAYDAILAGQRPSVVLSPHAFSVSRYAEAIGAVREHARVSASLDPYEDLTDVIFVAPGADLSNARVKDIAKVVRRIEPSRWDVDRPWSLLSQNLALSNTGELTPDEGAFSTVPVGDSIALDTALEAISRSTAGPVIHVDASIPEGDVIDLTFSLEHSTPTVVVHDVETLLEGPGALLVKELTDRRKGIFVVDLTPATIVPSRDGMMGRLRMLTRISTVGTSVSVITDRDGRRACFTAEAASCKPTSGSWGQIQCASSVVRAASAIGSVTPGEIKLGGLWWTVRGFSATRRFVAVTRTLRGEDVYSVLDLLLGVRGPDDSLFSEGWITDADITRGLRQMETGEIGISRRHRTNLEIQAQR